MTTDNIAWFFTAALATFLVYHLTKSYIDNKIRDIYLHIDANYKTTENNVNYQFRGAYEKIADLKREMETNRDHLWREIDTVWDKCHNDNKDCKKSYYNDGTGCCKSGPASEYLKG
jgi:hypothetical protein